jgi:hypothetical protein|tara:strand:+ start:5715 stop:6083 length:369 start_codon:yes stop_codon:yes gene_type:complete
MGDNKNQLIHTVKEWVRIDNEIRQLQKEISTRRHDKKLMNDKLMETMKTNDIDCFDLNDGKICYTKKNVKKPINNKVLLDILTKYYSGDISQASEINNFINDNRIEVTKENITRKISKTTDK